MYKILIATYFIVFSSLGIYAQHATNISNLNEELKGNMHDTMRVKLMAKLANEYLSQGDAKSSVECAKRSIELAEKVGYSSKLATLYNILANSYVVLSDYTKGIENHLKSLELSKERNNRSGIAISYNNIAIVYYNLADFPKAIEYLLKSLKIQEELGDKYTIAAAIGNIAVVYGDLNEDSLSMVYQQKSFDMHQQMGNKSDMVSSLNQLGTLYRKKNEFAKALDFHEKALSIASELDEKEGMKNTYLNLGNTYLKMKNPNEALTMFLKAITYSNESTDKKDISAIYINMATAYRLLERKDEAITYFQKALEISKSAGNLKEQKEASDGLYDIYKGKQDFKIAMTYHEQARKLNDSIFNVSKNESLNSLKTQFALDRQEVTLKAETETALKKKEEEKAKQQAIMYVTIGVLALVLFFSYLLFKRFKITQEQNKIIESQKITVEHKNKEITDSIIYTKRIQQAIIPPVELVRKNFPESFIYFKPKDIVAGDFYWMQQAGDHTYLAVADCTGHGVPGAMVSIVCSNALNSALKEFELRDTALILDKTRELVIETFEKSGEEIKDGMDISLIKIPTNYINSDKIILEWSGANNSLWYIENDKLNTVQCDKQSIGKTDDPKPFTKHTLQLNKGDVLYLMTDGFADQFGGPKGKKLKYKALADKLIEINKLSMIEQYDLLDQFFMHWKGSLEQVDDVSLVGIRV